MQPPILFKALDGGDGFSGRRTDRNLTRAAGRSADQDSARATLPFAAAVFAAGQTELIAQNIQQRCVRRVFDRIPLVIDVEFDRLRHDPSSQENFPPDPRL